MIPPMLAAVAVWAATWCAPAPTPGPVVRPFEAPSCTYCPGHRGIDYRTVPGSTVRAVADGSVTFAGQVAGVQWVVIAQHDGLRASYGRLLTPTVTAGAEVRAGDVVGLAGVELYFGWQRAGEPIDPTPYLGRPRSRLRLVPDDGTPRRPTVECPAARPGR